MRACMVGGVMVTRRLSGGDYAQDIRLIMFDRAEWDAESGLGVARLQIGIEAADPIEPATQVVSPGVVEHAADPIVPVGTVRVAVGDTLEVGEIGHGLEGAVTATSDDTGSCDGVVGIRLGGDGGGRNGGDCRRGDRGDGIERAAAVACPGAPAVRCVCDRVAARRHQEPVKEATAWRNLPQYWRFLERSCTAMAASACRA